MKEEALEGVSRRSTVFTTRRDRDARPTPDLVEREFVASGPDQLWVADITYIPTWAGFLYLSVVLDVWSRRIVGWAMATHLRSELVLDALNMAIAQRQPAGVIHHSDQGCQYTSIAFGCAVAKRTCGRRWVAWATATTTRCARASLPHWNASCSRAGVLRHRRKRVWQCSRLSRAGIIGTVVIRHSVSSLR
jgi:transposase InsO family protein